MRKSLAQLIRTQRRSGPMRLLARVAHRYLTVWYNEGFWDFERNGEARVLGLTAQWAGERPLRVWDVGAHNGEWAMAAHQALPASTITSFEIVPSVFAAMADQARGQDWWRTENLGLSDRAGEVQVHVSSVSDTTNSINPRIGGEFFPSDALEKVTCRVTTGDLYLQDGAVPPDLLKIDTEGHDLAVLRGCAGLLSGSSAPAIVQFEYGDTYLPSGSTLQAAYAMLEPAGYSIGRVYPTYVAFKPYDFRDDHFRMGNMVAVRDDRLRAMLAGDARVS